VLHKCPVLRPISIWGTGTDNIDLAAARTRGIRVTNTPGVSAVAVAEHTLALMMAIAKRTIQVDQEVRQGHWPRAMVTQLRGKTLGLIGTGAIGQEVARLGAGIGMRVIAWTFHPRGDVAEWVAFDDVFRQSDVVSVHVRLTTETSRLIRREHLELMKPGAILINTARAESSINPTWSRRS
jgi:D-3-phosphoglycerate dehydrogenase